MGDTKRDPRPRVVSKQEKQVRAMRQFIETSAAKGDTRPMEAFLNASWRDFLKVKDLEARQIPSLQVGVNLSRPSLEGRFMP